MSMCKWFFKDANKFKIAAEGQLQMCGRKNCKSQKLFKFYYHISHDLDMCRWQGLTEIPNGRHEST